MSSKPRGRKMTTRLSRRGRKQSRKDIRANDHSGGGALPQAEAPEAVIAAARRRKRGNCPPGRRRGPGAPRRIADGLKSGRGIARA